MLRYCICEFLYVIRDIIEFLKNHLNFVLFLALRSRDKVYEKM